MAPASRIRLVAFGAALCAAAVSSATPIEGQGVHGTVRLESTGEPLPGVLVSILGVDGQRLRGVLTDDNGRFNIEVPLGRYQLRAERLGLATRTTEPFDVNTFHLLVEDISVAGRALEIEGLVVDARVQSCRLDPRRAAQIQRWWSDIRTALDVSAALQREQFGRFLVESFEREWDADLKEILGSNSRIRVSESTRPFVSLPASDLVRNGFVQGGVGPDRQYFGPDAEVLLSSLFLAQHCFSLVERRERRGQLGLRFEPVKGRGVADIEGTLWVDTTTSELTDLEFSYTNIEGPDRDAGGQVVFDYLANGAWIVSKWYIRRPKTGVRGRRLRLVTTGFFEGGGAVTPLEPPSGGPVGTIRGVVVDSLRGGGLSGAVVTLLGTTLQTVTDEAGRFSLFEVPAGRQLLAFSHREVDAWNIGSQAFDAVVEAGAATEVELFVPGFERVARALCMANGVDARTLVTGHLLSADRKPIVGHPVRLIFEHVEGNTGNRVDLSVRTGDQGQFAACAIPPGETVTIRVRSGDEWVDVTELVTEAHTLSYREIWFTR
jgi:hypothetical protein